MLASRAALTVEDVALGVRVFLDCGAEQGDGAGVEFVGGLRLAVLEARREFVRVLEVSSTVRGIVITWGLGPAWRG